MMNSVIRLENFYFAYNKSELVLQDIDLEIKKGSFTVVAGPSGAGKTTLCKAMTGIVPFIWADVTAVMCRCWANRLKAAGCRISRCAWD